MSQEDERTWVRRFSKLVTCPVFLSVRCMMVNSKLYKLLCKTIYLDILHLQIEKYRIG